MFTNLFTTNKKSFYILQALIFLLIIFLSIIPYSSRNLTTSSWQVTEYTSSTLNTNHFNLFKDHAALIENLAIDLDFQNQDASFQYGNLFQTSSLSDGIRLELQPQNKLVLIAGEGHLYPIADNLKPNHQYKFQLRYSRHNHITAHFDGKLILNIQDREITNLKFYLQNFVVGSGFSLTRPFNGEISNFQANIQYSKPTLLATIST